MKERKIDDPAWLPSAGLDGKRATLHEFVRREAVNPATLHYSAEHGPRGIREAIAVIYRCTETGAERRYGLE